MDRGGQYNMDRGSIYHVLGGQNTMGREVDIPWVVGVNIPCVGGSIYHE